MLIRREVVEQHLMKFREQRHCIKREVIAARTSVVGLWRMNIEYVSGAALTNTTAYAVDPGVTFVTRFFFALLHVEGLLECGSTGFHNLPNLGPKKIASRILKERLI